MAWREDLAWRNILIMNSRIWPGGNCCGSQYGLLIVSCVLCHSNPYMDAKLRGRGHHGSSSLNLSTVPKSQYGLLIVSCVLCHSNPYMDAKLRGRGHHGSSSLNLSTVPKRRLEQKRDRSRFYQSVDFPFVVLKS